MIAKLIMLPTSALFPALPIKVIVLLTMLKKDSNSTNSNNINNNKTINNDHKPNDLITAPLFGKLNSLESFSLSTKAS